MDITKNLKENIIKLREKINDLEVKIKNYKDEIGNVILNKIIKDKLLSGKNWKISILYNCIEIYSRDKSRNNTINNIISNNIFVEDEYDEYEKFENGILIKKNNDLRVTLHSNNIYTFIKIYKNNGVMISDNEIKELSELIKLYNIQIDNIEQIKNEIESKFIKEKQSTLSILDQINKIIKEGIK